MLATNVAEPERDHAATLLRCARELLHVLQQASGRVGRAQGLQAAAFLPTDVKPQRHAGWA